MSKSTLQNRFFKTGLKIKQNIAKIELFSKWENWCPGQRDPKADCVPLKRDLTYMIKQTPNENVIHSTVSNALIVHQVKTNKSLTVKEVWIPGLN